MESNSSISSSDNTGVKARPVIGLIKAAAFLLLAFSMMLLFEAVFQNNGSVVERMRMIEQRADNSIDVLIIGNSHAYCTFDPAFISGTIGKRVYNAALPDQKIDTAYYNLKKLLGRQKPEIVILEAFTFGRSNSEYQGYVANIDALDFNIDKIKACFEIFPDKLEAARMLSSLYRCHSNWKKPEIVKKNLKYLLGMSGNASDNSDGFYALQSRMSEDTIKKYRESQDSKFTPVIDEYSVGYFDRIVELCRDRNIRLIVAMAPFNNIYLEKVNYGVIYDKMAGICSDAGVEYLDFNMLYDTLELDFGDFEDAFHNAQHMNKWGAEKVSKYLAQYLKTEMKSLP
jgi:hypothetical protein